MAVQSVLLKYFLRPALASSIRIMNQANHSSWKRQFLNLTSSTQFSEPRQYLHCKNFLRKLTFTAALQAEEQGVEEETEKKKRPVDPAKDRSRIIPPEVSIRYMNSKAYKITYGDDPVWTQYRRNFKGQFAPKKTRKRCIRGGVISTGNPCPICRDEYLVLHFTNVQLLKQFISPYTGEILDAFKTGICQRQQLNLEVAIEQAKYYGFITFEVPFREYNYEEFYPCLKELDY